MSEDTQPVAADNTGEQSTPDPVTETPKADSLFERLRAKYGANPGADEPAEESAAKVDEPEKPADKSEKKAEEKPAESDEKTGKEEPPKEEKPKEEPKKSRLELEHARTLHDLQKAQTEREALKRDNAKLKADFEATKTQAETLVADFKKNPLRALEKVTGSTFKEIIERAANKEFDSTPEPGLPPEVKAMQEKLERLEKEREAEKRAQKRQQEFAADLPLFEKFMAETTEQYPLLAASASAQDILGALYEEHDEKGGEFPDIRKYCEEAEATIKQNVTRLLKNKTLLSRASKDAAIKQTLLDALGITQQTEAGPASGTQGDHKQRSDAAPESSKGSAPRTVATQTEVPTRTDREPTDEELRAEQIRLLQKGRELGHFKG